MADDGHTGDDGLNKPGGLAELESEFSTGAFEALERDFQEVLSELVGDKSLEKFRVEYEKLHRALRKSHEQEKRLVKKCRELNAEIVNNAAKVQTALKLSQEDQANIATLRKEIDRAWKMVETAHQKEERAKETITSLKDEIEKLSKLVEKGAGLSMGQENQVKELKKEKEELYTRLEEQIAKGRQFEVQLEELYKQKNELELEMKDRQQGIMDLKQQLDKKNDELRRGQKNRENLDQKVKDQNHQLDQFAQENEELHEKCQELTVKKKELEKANLETKSTLDKAMRQHRQHVDRMDELIESLEKQKNRNADLMAEVATSEKDLKARNDQITRLTTERGQLERKLEREHKQVLKLRQDLEDSKTPLILAQREIHMLQKDLDQYKKAEETLNKDVSALERERNLQLKATQRAEAMKKEEEGKVSEKERIVNHLEDEITDLKKEIAQHKKLVFELEKERERNGKEASEQRNLCKEALEEVKLKEMRINELTKKVTEWEAKLKQQQQLYESVRSDRNVYSKNLIEAQDEIAEMKRKFKIMNHQIDQLKEEITAKDHALVKEHFDHEKAEKMKDNLREENGRMRKLLEANDDTINKQDAEIRRLAAMIRRMDDEALSQRKEYDQVINERDILGTQLIRRNDELALLYEKLKIQSSTLRKGEAQYAQRLQDLRTMKLKVVDLERELRIAKSSNSQMGDLKREVSQLQRELLQEKTKVKALSEELENPMNVHRWRKLEGSDPATYEMIQKIQMLQRRLISKTEEVVEKDLLLQEKEKLYIEMKNILARQPGPEVAEQLSVYQSSLKEKTRQMKAMAAELNMYQAQVNEYKYEIERLNRELQDVKRKYFEQKRRDQMAREMQEEEAAFSRLQKMQASKAKSSTTRFTGGGFAIK
mmetsp:Transcript_11726/g.15306  ORF Transcript_11726/g.15306 Transcript_11726/m.15306 type:complete len:887 (-) Transcript_11726:297-2957(-)